MKQPEPGKPAPPSGNKKTGFVLIVLVLLVSAILSILLIKTALSTITGLTAASIAIKSEASDYLAESCAQEALIKLHRDENYTGETLSLSNANCTVSVTEDGANRLITISSEKDNYYTNLNIQITVNPVIITTWDD